MIQFQMFDHQPERCEKYYQMLKDNLPVLEGIGSEADFEKYGDSLGWFDIDTWANGNDKQDIFLFYACCIKFF